MAFYIIVIRFIGRFYNPLVSRKIGSLELKMPFAHELPVYLKMFPLYSANLGRLVNILAAGKPDLKIIDVGANIGDTVALLSNSSRFKILCVEGDDRYYQIVKDNLSSLKNVTICKSFVGEKKESLNVGIDSARGTGQLVTSSSSVLMDTLDNLTEKFDGILPVDLIKIDTDGFDNAVIRGSKIILSRDKPVVFFEFMPDVLKEKESPEAIFEFLHHHGYFRALIYDNIGYLIADVALSDKSSLNSVIARYYGCGVAKYVDIAVFHQDCADIYQQCSEAEVNFFRNLN